MVTQAHNPSEYLSGGIQTGVFPFGLQRASERSVGRERAGGSAPSITLGGSAPQSPLLYAGGSVPSITPGGSAPQSPIPLVARRRGARMLFEVFAEERLCREVQVVGDLLDAHPRVLQQRLGLQDHRLVDPARRRLAAHLLDHRRKVFRRDVQLFGIEANIPFTLVVLLQQRHELVEKHLTAPLLGHPGCSRWLISVMM